MATTFKTLAEQLAELDGPAPKDYDPENISNPAGSSDDEPESGSDQGDEKAEAKKRAREHYVSVGKSKLRDHSVQLSGKAYVGSSVSRAQVEVDDEDDPFGQPVPSAEDTDGSEQDDESDGQDDSIDGEDDEDDETDGQDDDEDESDGSGNGEDDEMAEFSGFSDSDSGSESESTAQPQVRRSQPKLDKIGEILQASRTNSAVASAQAADAAKGAAVRAQRRAFDAILSIRIKLQAALVGSNNIAVDLYEDDQPAPKRRQDNKSKVETEKNDEQPKAPAKMSTETREAVETAQKAALSLWSSLDQLRQSLASGQADGSGSASAGSKRKRGPTDPDQIWAAMSAHEATARPYRDSVISKWADLTRPAEPARESRLRGLSGRAGGGPSQSLPDMLSSQLAMKLPELVGRTQIARSCAPIHSARALPSSLHIFDDADFYGLLLRDLLEQRNSAAANSAYFDPIALASGGGAGTDWNTVRRDINARSKARRQAPGVDTRVSRGRKLSYAVHDKLVDFSSRDAREVWPESRAIEMFAHLLGRRSGLAGLDAEQSSGSDDDAMVDEEAVQQEEAGPAGGMGRLRLF